MTVLRVAWQFLRVGILNEIQYRINFFIQLFRTLFSLAGGVIAILLIFDYTESLGGWRYPELLAVLGVFTLIGGLIQMVIQPNMQKLMEEIRSGLLDYTLTKPEDAQLLVSVRELRFWQLVDVIVGLVVIGYALALQEAAVGLIQMAVFAFLLFIGGLIVYSLWLIVATCAFWFISINDILELFDSLYQAGRFPLGIYPNWLRFGLTFLVPIGLAVTVPAEALTGRLSAPTLFGAVAMAVVLLAGSRLFWRFGLRSYAGASA